MELEKSEEELEKRREKRLQKKMRRFANDLGVMDIDEELDKKYQQTCSLLQERIRKNEELQLYIKNPESLKEKIAYFEYGTNGNLHRGYYCPSPVLDIVVGNCKRGRKVKQMNGSNCHYEYGFDKERRLVRIRIWWNGKWCGEEILVYEGDTCLGYSYELMGELEYMSEVVYEGGKPMSYKKLDAFKEKDIDFYEEIYEYNETGIEKVYRNHYHFGYGPHHLSERIYYFEHDEDRYLSRYYVKEVYSNPLKYGKFGNFPEPLEPQWYKVYLKRKI